MIKWLENLKPKNFDQRGFWDPDENRWEYLKYDEKFDVYVAGRVPFSLGSLIKYLNSTEHPVNINLVKEMKADHPEEFI